MATEVKAKQIETIEELTREETKEKLLECYNPNIEFCPNCVYKRGNKIVRYIERKVWIWFSILSIQECRTSCCIQGKYKK